MKGDQIHQKFVVDPPDMARLIPVINKKYVLAVNDPVLI
jgi:hypothetical protein